MGCNKKKTFPQFIFIKDKSVPIIAVTFVYIRNPPVGDLAANPFRLSLKNPTDWRAILPLGGLVAVQYSPKFAKSYRVVSKPPTRELAAVQYSPKFEKSYRVMSNPPTRGLSCSPVLA